MTHSDKPLATKANLQAFGQRLEARFSQVERRLAYAQSCIIKWFISAMVVQAAAIVALIKLLPGP